MLVGGILTALITVLSVAPGVRANISPPISFVGWREGIIGTFLTNLPVNLFWLSLILYLMGLLVRDRMFAISGSRWAFLAIVLVSTAIITVVGTAIDVSLLYERHEGDVFTLNPHPVRWGLAAYLVFASIHATTLLVLKMSELLSLVPAAVMMEVNVAWWSIFGGNLSSMVGPFVLAIVCLVLAPFPLSGLVRWHDRMTHACAASS
ncbi:MAG: hypothetical protein QXQ13_08035 [Thermoplasmata archaeon]